MRQQGGQIVELESVRGIAAMLVVLFHIPKWNQFLSVGLIDHGYLMVDLFFVLSGFVIFSAYQGRIDSPRALLRFQFLRLGRLYPVHLVFLGLFFLIEAAKYWTTRNLASEAIGTVPFSENNLTALWQQLLLIQAIGPTGNAWTFNAPSWSISVEFYTYLIFGLVLLGRTGRHLLVFGAISLISIGALVLNIASGFEYLAQCTGGFFLGCLTAHIAESSRRGAPAIALPLAMLGMVGFVQWRPNPLWDNLIYPLSALLIWAIVASSDSPWRRALRHPLLTRLGAWSYAVYMAHEFVLWVVENLLKRGLKLPLAPNNRGKMILALTPSQTLAAVIAVLLATLVVAALTYRYIEQPLRDRSRLIAGRI